MATNPVKLESDTALGDAFLLKVEGSLRAADAMRRRRALARRAQRAAIALVLVLPIVCWRLMQATPGGLHVTIDLLSWLTFLLDVGIHLDSAVLSYLGLQFLPSVVGVLLLTVLTAGVLFLPDRE